MKFSPALLASLACALSASAQLATLPASSTDDGVPVHSFSPAIETQWGSSVLYQYRVAPDNPLPPPTNGGVDAHGVTWTNQSPDRNALNGSGGTYRLISLGVPGSWLNGFGYSYAASPASSDSFTLGLTCGFGDHAEIKLSPGAASTFDFWLNTQRGAYTLFDPANSITSQGPAQILWSQALLVPTFIPAANSTQDVQTWIVSLVENPENGDDGPHEFRFAIQTFANAGAPVGGAAIPEPETFSLIGGLLLAGAAAWRIRSRK
jgi:hypothetical protein